MSEERHRILQEVIALKAKDKEEDWATRVQDVSLALWRWLETTITTDELILREFVELMGLGDGFAVARLVIPEMRAPFAPTGGIDSPKAWVLHHLQHARNTLTKPASEPLPDMYTELYRAEREIYHDLEVYRAGLALFGTGSLTADQTLQVKGDLEKEAQQYLG
ncbi:hypothetical protein KC349_g2987 [Hortaea werneckii]|nr:hypothetical protein KC349_g2987 [Hortaea werneckii]